MPITLFLSSYKITKEFYKLLEEERAENQAFDLIYTHFFTPIIRQLMKDGASEEEAKDIFQQSLHHFLVKVKLGTAPKVDNLKAYLLTNCRRKWIDLIRSKKRGESIIKEMKHKELQKEKEMIYKKPELIPMLPQEKKEGVLAIFNILGEKCKLALEHLYFNHYSFGMIAEELGWKDAQNARVSIGTCRKKLTKYLDEHPLLRTELYNLIAQ